MRFGFLSSRGRVGAWIGVATLVLCGGLMAEEPVDYLKQVKPLLAERCLFEKQHNHNRCANRTSDENLFPDRGIE